MQAQFIKYLQFSLREGVILGMHGGGMPSDSQILTLYPISD